MSAPWTPVTVETRLDEIDRALDDVVEAVRAARDLEVVRHREYKRARFMAILSEDCPKVTRGGTPAAERDAWVDRSVDIAEYAYEQATAAREYAVDQMFKVKDQASIVGKIGDLVRQAYAMAGR